jgi:hypothetical protein
MEIFLGIVRHRCSVTIQMPQVVMPYDLVADILWLIARLRVTLSP